MILRSNLSFRSPKFYLPCSGLISFHSIWQKICFWSSNSFEWETKWNCKCVWESFYLSYFQLSSLIVEWREVQINFIVRAWGFLHYKVNRQKIVFIVNIHIWSWGRWCYSCNNADIHNCACVDVDVGVSVSVGVGVSVSVGMFFSQKRKKAKRELS